MRVRGQKARMFGALAFAGLLAAVTFALTASNTVPGSKAGAGSGAISGYTVSDIKYTLNATTPTTIDAVAFKLAGNVPTSATAKVQLDSTGGSCYSCTIGLYDALTNKTAVSCATTSSSILVVDADNLTVLATE